MPNLYQGIDTSYPTDIHTPADGEDCDESILDLPLQQLADRSAWLKRRVFTGALDILWRVAVGPAQNFGACYVPGYDEIWIVGEGVSASAQIYKSTNQGPTFTREAAADGAIITNPTFHYGIAANANGDLIAVNSQAHWQSYDRATATWYADGWATPGPWTRIVYVPTLDKFAIVGVTGGNLTAKHTPAADIHNANSPTTQIGGGGTWNNFTTGLAVNPTTGLVVAVGISGGAPRVAYTTDGGDNWTTIAALASLIVAPERVDVCYGGDGYFYLTVGESTGTDTGEVWRSSDAITWTKVATFAANTIHNLAGFGERLVGVTATGSMVTSTDQGVTWKRIGHVTAGTPLKIENCGGRAVLLTSTRADISATLGAELGSAIA